MSKGTPKEQRDMLVKLLGLLIKRRWKSLVSGILLTVLIVVAYFDGRLIVQRVRTEINHGLVSIRATLPTTLGANYLLIVLIAATVGVAFIPFLGHTGIVLS